MRILKKRLRKYCSIKYRIAISTDLWNSVGKYLSGESILIYWGTRTLSNTEYRLSTINIIWIIIWLQGFYEMFILTSLLPHCSCSINICFFEVMLALWVSLPDRCTGAVISGCVPVPGLPSILCPPSFLPSFFQLVLLLLLEFQVICWCSKITHRRFCRSPAHV